jgi:hypothetical protein
MVFGSGERDAHIVLNSQGAKSAEERDGELVCFLSAKHNPVDVRLEPLL